MTPSWGGAGAGAVITVYGLAFDSATEMDLQQVLSVLASLVQQVKY